MDLLFKGGTLVTAQSTFKADIAVTNGKISEIGTNLMPQVKTEVVDVEGKLILPGAIDGHTHLAMPFGGTVSTDDYYAGTRAAACGGTRPPAGIRKGGPPADRLRQYRSDDRHPHRQPGRERSPARGHAAQPE